MPSTTAAFDPKRLFAESLPVAGVLLFWNVFAVAVSPQSGVTALGLRAGGTAMALLHLAGRVASLTGALPATPAPVTPGDHLREDGRVLLAAGGWFLAAVLVSLPRAVGVWRFVVDGLAFPFAATGVGVVLLYVVPTALTRHRRGEPDADGTPAGDDAATASD